MRPGWRALLSLACWFRVSGRADAAAGLAFDRGAGDPHARERVQMSDVRVWANADYVDANKYKSEMRALAPVDVSPVVRLELRDPLMSTLVVPELEFKDLLRVSAADGSGPKRPDAPMNETVLDFVESGHTLILSLSTQVGFNFPLRLANDVFGWNLKGFEIPSGSVVKETEDGLAFAFREGPPQVPVSPGGVHGVTRASLPKGSRCVYGSPGFDACAVSFTPAGKGVVVLIGYPAAATTATPGWDQLLSLAALLGRQLPMRLRGNATLSGTSSAKLGEGDGLEIFGRPGTPKGSPCVAWRRTLSCHPSGPRQEHGDRGCTEMIPTDESGFCECAGGELTAASTCSHRAFTCDNACGKVGEQFRKIYGEAYEPPEIQDMLDQLAGADAAYERARRLADHAVQKVTKSVTASKDLVDAARKHLRGTKDAWETLDEAGRKQVAAAKVMKDMVDVATHTPARGANVATEDNRPWWIAGGNPADRVLPPPGSPEAIEALGR